MKLSKEAREFIVNKIEETGEMTTEDAMEIIRPHYIFDSIKAKDREIRTTAHQIMRGIRDTNGNRKCFNCKTNAHDSKYINVETTTNMGDLLKVNKQIDLKYYGLNQSRKKIKNRIRELEGQISLSEFTG